MAAQNQGDLFDAYFRRADLDKDGKISGAEAVAFFQGSNLSKQVLAQVWNYANQNRADYLGRAEFYNALKLVTVAQSKRELTPDIVKAALYGPGSARIPVPQINLAAIPAPQSSFAGVSPSTSQIPAIGTVPAQNPGFRPALPNTTMNQPYNQSPGSGIVRPPISSSGVAVQQQQPQAVGFQGFPGGSSPLSSTLPNSRPSTDVGAANAGKPSAVLLDRGSIPLANLAGLPSGAPGPVGSLPPKPSVTTGVNSLPSAMQPRSQVSQNGFASGPHVGDGTFSAAPSEAKNNGPVATASAGSVQMSSASVPVASSTKSVGGGQSKMQALLSAQTSPHTLRPSGPSTALPQQPAGRQPQLQWPRATQTDIQKYTKVFVEVDTDKDGKISGQQARDLFLSWRLPREVLKQVWDLSDQDNDSMLSVREFCIALYLMERYREGRPLPSVLPSSVMLDFPSNAQPASGYGHAAWGYSGGFQQPVPGTGPRPNVRPPGKPPLPVPAPSSDDRLPPKPQKAKVPMLEKNLVDQLSEEEQKSLNLKFQEATEANKKVEELEKEIKESREKIEFYRVKMQELVLYKSRCDNRLNEVTERAAGDKREVEALAKKYEEKYRQAGDVASKLSIEEASFRDIQERKMEMYQAIVKMEQDGTDETLQGRADSIQSNLEELVRSLSERCKKYGLRAKPTTLTELPFGWQAGIQDGAADWDEDWDKFEDEGFTFVKEMTLDVQNIIAPPKPKVKPVKKEKKLAAEDEGSIQSSEVESKPAKPATDNGVVAENGTIAHDKEDNAMQSPVASPSAKGSLGSPRDQSKENQSEKIVGSKSSPRSKESQSEAGVADASISGDKKSDPPTWGTFDTSDDTDSAWGSSKRHIDDLFGHGEFTLPPIRTGSSRSDAILPKKSIFADSVPGTPADGFLPQKSIFADSVPGTPADPFLAKPSIFADSVPGTPADGFLPKQSIFADSVPSTPLYSSSYSPRRDGEGQEDRSFNLSRFDSFRSIDSGFQPQERLSRFDSIRSTRDFDSQDDSFQQKETLSRFDRFDSMRSTNESDFGQRFSSFDDSDPFGAGPFQSSFGSETPRRDSDAFGSSAFRSSLGSETPRSEVDPFGSVGPFRSSISSETPRANSDPFGSVGPFRSSLGSETPRGEADYFGSGGPFRSSFGGETPRADADHFGSGGPFRSSFGGETPRADADHFGSVGPFGMGSETPPGETNYFGYSGSFRSSVGSETPKGGFDSFGYGGPFGSETPRRDSDAFGAAPFKSSFGTETPKGGTDSWSAF